MFTPWSAGRFGEHIWFWPTGWPIWTLHPANLWQTILWVNYCKMKASVCRAMENTGNRCKTFTLLLSEVDTAEGTLPFQSQPLVTSCQTAMTWKQLVIAQPGPLVKTWNILLHTHKRFSEHSVHNCKYIWCKLRPYKSITDHSFQN